MTCERYPISFKGQRIITAKHICPNDLSMTLPCLLDGLVFDTDINAVQELIAVPCDKPPNNNIQALKTVILFPIL